MRPGTEAFHQVWPEIGQAIEEIVDKFEQVLGESPEARRGAYEMGRMLSESLDIFLGAISDPEIREKGVFMIGAPIIFFKERYEEMKDMAN